MCTTPPPKEYITLGEAARLAPGRPAPSTVWRWCRRGVRTATGGRVHLEHWRFGRRIYTTREALRAFGARIAEHDVRHFGAAPETRRAETPVVTERTRTERQKAALNAVERMRSARR